MDLRLGPEKEHGKRGIFNWNSEAPDLAGSPVFFFQ